MFVSIYHGGEIFYIFSIAAFTYMFVMLKSGYLHYKSLKENIELKETFQNRVQDATSKLEEKNARLNESLTNFQEILDTSMVMISFEDENGIMVDVNKSAVLKFGYKNKSEIVGTHVTNHLPEKSIPIVLEALEHELSQPYELIIKRKDATEFPALVTAKYITLNGQRVRMSVMMDLTDIKEKEKLLYKQSKLAQMGEMISMIAHQWRQPLSAISSTSAAINLKSQLNTLDKESLEKMTDDITAYSKHLSETIDDFRNFFKPSKEKSQTSFIILLSSILNILEVSLNDHNIKIVKELQSDDAFASYPNELKQVILNILKNAQDALVENGVSDGFIKLVTKREANRVILEISDNAGGIDEKIIDDIFNPYFSTKKQKDGTGLGLYMSKIIIEQHCNGELSVFNNKDGAVFRISLNASVE